MSFYDLVRCGVTDSLTTSAFVYFLLYSSTTSSLFWACLSFSSFLPSFTCLPRMPPIRLPVSHVTEAPHVVGFGSVALQDFSQGDQDAKSARWLVLCDVFHFIFSRLFNDETTCSTRIWWRYTMAATGGRWVGAIARRGKRLLVANINC